MCVYIFKDIHTYIRTYIHTYIHTYAVDAISRGFAVSCLFARGLYHLGVRMSGNHACIAGLGLLGFALALLLAWVHNIAESRAGFGFLQCFLLLACPPISLTSLFAAPSWPSQPHLSLLQRQQFRLQLRLGAQILSQLSRLTAITTSTTTTTDRVHAGHVDV